MNFYLSALDDMLRNPDDKPIAGPSICFLVCVEINAASIASAVFKSRVPVL
jgi:hypothetical protein